MDPLAYAAAVAAIGGAAGPVATAAIEGARRVRVIIRSRTGRAIEDAGEVVDEAAAQAAIGDLASFLEEAMVEDPELRRLLRESLPERHGNTVYNTTTGEVHGVVAPGGSFGDLHFGSGQ
ncbi:hypothetical protein ACWFR1_37820 [Streptomyces sp. NPDC055103]